MQTKIFVACKKELISLIYKELYKSINTRGSFCDRDRRIIFSKRKQENRGEREQKIEQIKANRKAVSLNPTT